MCARVGKLRGCSLWWNHCTGNNNIQKVTKINELLIITASAKTEYYRLYLLQYNCIRLYYTI